MNRRTFLGTIGSGAVATTGGCVGTLFGEYPRNHPYEAVVIFFETYAPIDLEIRATYRDESETITKTFRPKHGQYGWYPDHRDPWELTVYVQRHAGHSDPYGGGIYAIEEWNGEDTDYSDFDEMDIVTDVTSAAVTVEHDFSKDE